MKSSKPDRLERRWCSWCFERSTHREEKVPALATRRTIYRCRACNRLTVLCRWCDQMARRLVKGEDGARHTRNHSNCAVHRGWIGSFETLRAEIDDPGEFVALMRRRDGANVVRRVRTIGIGLGAAAAVSPFVIVAAPAIGALAASTGIGTGLLGSAGAGMFLSAVGSAAGGVAGGLLANEYLGDVKDFGITKVRDGKDPALILVDGFLKQRAGNAARWLEGLGRHYADRAVYYVRWESKRMRDLGRLAAGGSFSSALGALTAHTAIRISKRAAASLGPLMLPMAAVGLANNPWFVALIKAQKTGELLKEALARCRRRSFLLMGHSLGARVIFHALQGLGTIPPVDRKSRIAGVHLLGGAVGTQTAAVWSKALEGCEGPVQSYRSRHDQVLQVLYRIGTLMRSEPIGLKAIPKNASTRARIANFNAAPRVKGHLDYHQALSSILRPI